MVDFVFQCLTTMSFVKSNENILEQPCWIIIINLVSLDFLRTSLAQQPGQSGHDSEGDDYNYCSSVFTLRAGRLGEGRQRPRLSLPYEHSQTTGRSKKVETREPGNSQTLPLKKRKEKKKNEAGGDSLYYCGIQARISQFVLSEANRNRSAVQQSLRWGR